MPILPIAITLGDPAGIGPEVTARALDHMASEALPLVVGPKAALDRALKTVGSDLTTIGANPNGSLTAPPGAIAVLDTSAAMPGLPAMGKVSAEGGAHAMAALGLATDFVLGGRVSALVTAPLNKEAVRLAGFSNFIGHTEFLAQRAGNMPVRMMMTCPSLSVVLATTHHPLKALPALVDEETVLTTLRIAHDAWLKQHGTAPRMAVCGLNPHPGEFGDEDALAITPAVEQAQSEGLLVDGPYAADALFPKVVQQNSHDLVIAMYHDQGLVPVKLLGLEQTVNITLGLPFVRTSPGHGTGFDIAAQGIANPSAMVAAIAAAIQAAETRARANIQITLTAGTPG